MTAYCEECSKEIVGKPVILKYDPALDADDGYGDYFEVILCQECASGKPIISES